MCFESCEAVYLTLQILKQSNTTNIDSGSYTRLWQLYSTLAVIHDSGSYTHSKLQSSWEVDCSSLDVYVKYNIAKDQHKRASQCNPQEDHECPHINQPGRRECLRSDEAAKDICKECKLIT